MPSPVLASPYSLHSQEKKPLLVLEMLILSGLAFSVITLCGSVMVLFLHSWFIPPGIMTFSAYCRLLARSLIPFMHASQTFPFHFPFSLLGSNTQRNNWISCIVNTSNCCCAGLILIALISSSWLSNAWILCITSQSVFILSPLLFLNLPRIFLFRLYWLNYNLRKMRKIRSHSHSFRSSLYCGFRICYILVVFSFCHLFCF